MKKNNSIIKQDTNIRSEIDKLDKNKIHILYFKYYLNFHNLYHSPLLLTTKLLNFFTRKPQIDHVCHISRFVFDEENNKFDPKIFEANIARGMEQNDLIDRLQAFQGVCYIETLEKDVNKEEAKKFENDYRGVPYSEKLAALAGLDGFLFNKIKFKTDGGFCSWLVGLFLKSQGINIGNFSEMTPSDIFNKNLSKKDIFYKA